MGPKYALYEEDKIDASIISVLSHSEVALDNNTWLVDLAPDSTNSASFRFTKRAFDLFGVLLVSPLLVPLLLMVTALVKLTSAGPAFFSHRRICRDGEFFSMFKFRTMVVDSSAVLEQYFRLHPEALSEWQTTHKLRCDPRVTPLGRVLRRLSLDELPQIWNVIKGQMSLVGPRPIVAAEVEKYGQSFHVYTAVNPGITGLWQVSGRSLLTYEERVELDCRYVLTFSVWQDVKILAMTAWAVVSQEGAY